MFGGAINKKMLLHDELGWKSVIFVATSLKEVSGQNDKSVYPVSILVNDYLGLFT